MTKLAEAKKPCCYTRTIRCIRHGVLLMWVKGDAPEPTANLNKVFDLLSAHHKMRRGCLLAFKEEEP